MIYLKELTDDEIITILHAILDAHLNWGLSINEIKECDNRLTTISNLKISALLRKMKIKPVIYERLAYFGKTS